MRRQDGIPLSICSAVSAPIQLAWTALSDITKDLEANPGREALALDLDELEIPFEAKLAVPIKTRFATRRSRYEKAISIKPTIRRDVFPCFSGVLAFESTLARTCQLRLDGTYTVPLGILGKTIDMTFTRGAAKASLQGLLDRPSQQLVERIERNERKYANAVH